MIVKYDVETLDLAIRPETEDERRFVLKLVQSILGGKVLCKPTGKARLITKFKKMTDGAKR